MSTVSPANSARRSQLASSNTSTLKMPGLIHEIEPANIPRSAYFLGLPVAKPLDHEIVHRVDYFDRRACQNGHRSGKWTDPIDQAHQCNELSLIDGVRTRSITSKPGGGVGGSAMLACSLSRKTRSAVSMNQPWIAPSCRAIGRHVAQGPAKCSLSLLELGGEAVKRPKLPRHRHGGVVVVERV